ncbi:hypothetical protein CH360_17795, partial [Leptospira perolatii]
LEVSARDRSDILNRTMLDRGRLPYYKSIKWCGADTSVEPGPAKPEAPSETRRETGRKRETHSRRVSQDGERPGARHKDVSA